MAAIATVKTVSTLWKFRKELAGLLIACFVLFFLAIMMIIGGEEETKVYEGVGLSEKVLRFRPIVERYAKEYGVQEHVDILLAIMQQESGGNAESPNVNGDVMQSSESKYGYKFGITSVEESIQQGTKIFASKLEKSKDIEAILQSYNFGDGYLSWLKKNGAEHSKEKAIEFSAMMYSKSTNKGAYSCVRSDLKPQGACYGDPYYAEAVLKYVTEGEDGSSAAMIDKTGKFALPVAGIPQITSPYGMRLHPIKGEMILHAGMDFACTNYVSKIYSVENGTVELTKNNPGGYGLYVVVRHGENLYSQYAHLSKISVKEGQKLKQGESVGICGNTGGSTGPHLHFEIRTSNSPRKTVDPQPLLGL